MKVCNKYWIVRCHLFGQTLLFTVVTSTGKACSQQKIDCNPS